MGEWYWVPQKVAGAENPAIKLTKPKKDAPIQTVVEFLKKHSAMDFDVDDVIKRFEEQMIVNPPPTTTPPPPMPSMNVNGFQTFNMQAAQGITDENSENSK